MNLENNAEEYMKLWMSENVLEFPACMSAQEGQENLWMMIYVGAGIIGSVALMILLWKFCGEETQKRAKHDASFGGMYGQWGPPLFIPGKGGKAPAGFGKGGKGPADAGKGMIGKKGNWDQGKGKGKGKWDQGKGKAKGKWDQGFPEVAAPDPAPLDISVTVVGASNLRKADVTGSSDPFCEFGIAGKDAKYKTKVVKKNIHPEWKQTERIKKFDENEKLEFHIYDDDLGGTKRDLLGKVTLNYEDFFPDGLDGELMLEEVGDAKDAKVKVKVEILAILPKEEKKK